ncbi:hypothetical protein IE53DRAFT_282531 [Violaceomyces palustris]|uniref:Uncharacterized protein n=1 Tax=Violaceomyces palustris TaxID=1673888 RepID=A0ACD0NM53_9BASI|nr:hypothetical protein IE53DRAFT_282531 [Violaceomyces palustris]
MMGRTARHPCLWMRAVGPRTLRRPGRSVGLSTMAPHHHRQVRETIPADCSSRNRSRKSRSTCPSRCRTTSRTRRQLVVARWLDRDRSSEPRRSTLPSTSTLHFPS